MVSSKCQWLWRWVLKKRFFDHFRKYWPTVVKSHFIFQKWCYFLKDIYRSEILQNSFGHIIAIMQQSRSILTSKINWKRFLRSNDDYLSFRFFGINFIPETFLISRIFQVYRIKFDKDTKVFRFFFCAGD